MKSKKNILPFWISLVTLIVLWHIFTSNGSINDLFVPGIGDLISGTYTLFAEKGFIADIGISVWRVWFSFLLAFLVAIPLSLFMSENRVVLNLFSPYIDFIRYLPIPALIPLTILFFGIDETSKIVLLFIGTFFPLILLVLDDLKAIPKEYFDMAYTLKFNRFETYLMKLRAIAPNIYDNSRISIGICWTYLIIAELVASERGVGHLIKEAQRFSHTSDIYTGILTIGLIGFMTDFAFKAFYPVIFKYKKASINQMT